MKDKATGFVSGSYVLNATQGFNASNALGFQGACWEDWSSFLVWGLVD